MEALECSFFWSLEDADLMGKSLLRLEVHSGPSGIVCFSVQMPPAQSCQEVPPMQFQVPSSKHNSTGVLGLDLETAELRSPEKIIMDDYL